MSKKFYLFTDQVKKNCIEIIDGLEIKNNKPYEVIIKEATRKVIQNNKMWVMLGEISNQVQWYGQKLSSDEWKDVLSASLFQLETVPSVDGRKMVLLGKSTSSFTVSQMTDMIEFMYAFGAERNVEWKG